MAETLPYSSSGGIPHGSRLVTIDGVAYVAENFRPTRPTRRLERDDQVGAPNGFKLLKARKTATATLQLATVDTPIPGRGREFAGEAKDAVVAWVIETVSDPEEAGALRTVEISVLEKA